MRQLALEGRIKMFKSLAISKVIHLLLTAKLDNNTIDLMCKIQKNFIWQSKKATIKHSTLCNGYENGSLTVNLCTFIGQLFSDNWKAKPWEDIKMEFHPKDTQKIFGYKLLMLYQIHGKTLI